MEETVRIISDSTGIRILGATPIAVRHGAYILLEKMGVRWLAKNQDWDVVPPYFPDIGYFDETHQPAFIWRRMWCPNSYDFSKITTWRRRQRLGGAKRYGIAHSYGNIIGSSEVSTLPDVFLPENTNPLPAAWQLKPDHPTVVARAIAYARVQLSKPAGPAWDEPDVLAIGMVSISPNDDQGWGSYMVPPNSYQWLSDKVINLTNEVAKVVAVEFPGCFAGVYLYSLYSTPPSFNVSPALAAEITTAYTYGTDLTDEQRMQMMLARGAGAVGVYDYMDPWSWTKEDVPWWIKPIWNRVKNFAAAGTTMYELEQGDSWGAAGIPYYIGAKLAWNPTADIPTLLADYYDKAFGPAADVMKRFYDRWFDGPNTVTDNSMALAFRDLAEAQRLVAAANRPDCLTRVRHVQYWMRYRWLAPLSGIQMVRGTAMVQTGTMDAAQMSSYYSFITQLRTLNIIYSVYCERNAREVLTDLGLTVAQQDSLINLNPPTAAQADAWMAEALDAFANLTPIETDPAPIDVNTLMPLGNTTLPRLAGAMNARQETVLVKANAGDVVQARLQVGWDNQYVWTDPDGIPVTVPLSGASPAAVNLAAPKTGVYTLTAAGIDIISHPAGLINEKLGAGSWYFYVPPNTKGLIVQVSTGAGTSNVYAPNGSLAFQINGGVGSASNGMNYPPSGVWRLDFTGDINLLANFQLLGVPNIVWHDANKLLVQDPSTIIPPPEPPAPLPPGTPITTIALLSPSDAFISTAAQELKTYIEQMSGQAVTIVGHDVTGPAIRLEVGQVAPPAPNEYTVNISVQGQGSTNPAGSFSIAEDTLLSITPTAATGWKFDHWEGSASGTAKPLQLTVLSDLNIIAVFVEDNNPPPPEPAPTSSLFFAGVAALIIGAIMLVSNKRRSP